MLWTAFIEVRETLAIEIFKEHPVLEAFTLKASPILDSSNRSMRNRRRCPHLESFLWNFYFFFARITSVWRLLAHSTCATSTIFPKQSCLLSFLRPHRGALEYESAKKMLDPLSAAKFSCLHPSKGPLWVPLNMANIALNNGFWCGKNEPHLCLSETRDYFTCRFNRELPTKMRLQSKRQTA